jgi:uracil-DNA glycosylase, family 4
MSDVYEDLLEAAIQHLQDLKAHGTRFVSVTPETMAALLAAPTRAVAHSATRSPGPATSPAMSQTRASVTQPAPVTSAKLAPSDVPVASNRKTAGGLSKADAIDELRQRAMSCVKCAHLASSRKNVVFGVGNVESDLMFVGEAPGADEDVQGEPFVGRAGQLLTKIIEATGLNRSSVYIANILKCRPDTPGESSGNRKPTPQEMQTCIPFLHEQIDIIQPKVLVALGGTAVEGLLGKTVGITRLRGVWQIYRGIPLMPTFHPSYLLRDQSVSQKRLVWEDMLQVMEKLGMNISEKQRKFFTKA